MTRRTLVPAISFLVMLLVPAAPALAGGGCHMGVTQGIGDTVEMVDACFTPTNLKVEPGDTVTFVNTDDFVHNVAANQWGHFEDLFQGDAFTATFAEEGVYPYACSYHPGMSGSIVVGDGDGAGSGEAVAVSPFEPPAPSPEVEVRTVTVTEDAGAGSPLVWLAATFGLAVGLGLGLLTSRRRARVGARTPAAAG